MFGYINLFALPFFSPQFFCLSRSLMSCSLCPCPPLLCSQVFVCLVIALTSSVVVVVYLCLLPVILNTYPLQWIIWHLTYGHWVLMMVLFHYYKATTTSPGHPPQVRCPL